MIVTAHRTCVFCWERFARTARPLEPSVCANKASARTKRPLERSVYSNEVSSQTKRPLKWSAKKKHLPLKFRGTKYCYDILSTKLLQGLCGTTIRTNLPTLKSQSGAHILTRLVRPGLDVAGGNKKRTGTVRVLCFCAGSLSATFQRVRPLSSIAVRARRTVALKNPQLMDNTTSDYRK